ncbi:MAG TPA: hypothetical protein DIT13_11705 [Verrucomicrobiales bacterium]|nr:hypothetical protein [Verrucomicrobiales bacterium]HRJ09646.1 hypothetical protein [Prosthecobacter sp.]HRK14625.1 hypothetical protein [Prosthecobacter sp.]
MKTPSEDHDLIRWLDDELPPLERERFVTRMNADPILRGEAEAMRELARELRAHLPKTLPVPHADFFNSQIQVRIAREENPSRASRTPAGSWLEWFRLPGLALGAAAAALVFGATFAWQHESLKNSLVLTTYAPDPGVTAQTWFSDDAQATVLMLDGLEEMPADRPLVGFLREANAERQMLAVALQNEHGTPHARPRPDAVPLTANLGE